MCVHAGRNVVCGGGGHRERVIDPRMAHRHQQTTRRLHCKVCGVFRGRQRVLSRDGVCRRPYTAAVCRECTPIYQVRKTGAQRVSENRQVSLLANCGDHQLAAPRHELLSFRSVSGQRAGKERQFCSSPRRLHFDQSQDQLQDCRFWLLRGVQMRRQLPMRKDNSNWQLPILCTGSIPKSPVRCTKSRRVSIRLYAIFYGSGCSCLQIPGMRDRYGVPQYGEAK
mmetsp:Transcript_43383/g.69517  ORF Transcript_43383/g.69517 Transcript_43383/m.69517 type:complete len:224 (+) Transcript_43383:462-1133(+)